MQPAANRKQNYDAKVVPATVSLKVAARLPDMQSRYASAVTSLAAVEQQIQGLLNGAAVAVQTIQYPFYLNFGREVWKREWNGLSGSALLQFATDLTAKYVSYGCLEANLIAIALECFDLTVPPAGA